MKTNYMNLKQQLAGVTIVIAAVFCLAWLAPTDTTKDKEENKTTGLRAKSSQQASSKVSGFNELVHDTIITPKKKPEVKIIVTEENGKVKEYNSLKALPESLKAGMGMFHGRNLSFIADSLIINGKALNEQMNGVFNNPEFLKAQKEVAEQFNSPEFKENMKKAFLSFNSQFKKKQEELMKNFNSAEFKKEQAELIQKLKKEHAELIPKLKKEQADVIKQQTELTAKLKMEQVELIPRLKNEAELIAKMNSKEFKESKRENLFKLGHRIPTLKLDGPDFTISGVDSLFFSGENKGNYRIYLESREKNKQEKELENNKQYQKLKKKFERDVEKLRKKQVEEGQK